MKYRCKRCSKTSSFKSSLTCDRCVPSRYGQNGAEVATSATYNTSVESIPDSGSGFSGGGGSFDGGGASSSYDSGSSGGGVD